MKKEWNDVREFHEKFGHPCPDAPRMLDKKRSLSRAKWMNEEVAEFLVAEDIYEQADAMIDLMYFALGTMVEMGLEPDELFEIVQQANMAKLWGLPVVFVCENNGFGMGTAVERSSASTPWIAPLRWALPRPCKGLD